VGRSWSVSLCCLPGSSVFGENAPPAQAVRRLKKLCILCTRIDADFGLNEDSSMSFPEIGVPVIASEAPFENVLVEIPAVLFLSRLELVPVTRPR